VLFSPWELHDAVPEERTNMLTIKVWCLPRLSQKKLEALFWGLVWTVEGIDAMVKAGHKGVGKMLILFPSDMMKLGLGAEVLVEVDGLNNVPECNLSTRNELAKKLGAVVQRFVPKAQVDCRVYKPDPSIGCWQSARRKMPVERRPKCHS
jgi:hypothetical protein